MQYFGGGKDAVEARQPLIVETKAGKIAFVGINNMGPAGVYAGEGIAGSAPYDETTFSDTLDSISAEDADIVWVDTHLWPEYSVIPENDQITISSLAVQKGAEILRQ